MAISIMTRLKYFFIVFFVFSLIAPSVLLHAQETPEQRRSRLEAELAQYEREIAEKEKILAEQKKQTGSLQRDVSILTNQIDQAKLKIKARTISITKINSEIGKKNEKIETLEEKMTRQKESLAQLIRKTDEIDDSNVVHLILSSEEISEFYGDVDTFASIKQSVKSSVDQIKTVKTETLEEKKGLEKKQDEELDAKAELESAKKKVEVSEAEKKKLVSVSKGREKEYEQILKERRAKAAQIRAALFSVRDSAAIPFGKALEYAIEAERRTGVRPAFLLAILTQESNLGQNTGSCYLSDPLTGAGTSVRSGAALLKVMKPDRDVSPFLSITKAVGRDPYKTLISCPQSIGWGGAMGPAQFIPSTWMMYNARLKVSLETSAPDPWNPEHAFMASATYLSDLGANAKTYSAERNAACRYYSGKPCTALAQAMTYGNSVMGKAASIQTNQIDPLEGL
ncbi:MAG: 2 protein [Patescibacteria group bacterium]|mgnify:CR=1 FL=1|nr:2 protein [Patescibacteria group bacterium]